MLHTRYEFIVNHHNIIIKIKLSFLSYICKSFNSIMNLKSNIKPSFFHLISDCGKELGQSVYVVGGFVRDTLLNRHQHQDIDFVTEGNGILLAELIHKKLNKKNKLKFFKRFGTAVIHHQGIDLEFVGARKESYSSESRKPFIEFGTLVDDQNRRDFTINALAISLNQENYGELLDPFNGISDLENKVLKTPLDPKITFSDDPLRMIRAIRFASQLNFIIEQNSLKAIQQNKERLKIVSMDRISTELNKILLLNKPSVGLNLLHQTELLDLILPELTLLQGIEEIEGNKHKDNFFHTLEVVDNIAENTDKLYLRWSALLHDIGKSAAKKYIKNIGWTFHLHEFIGSKMVKKIFQRLRLPINNNLKYVEKLVRLSSRPASLIDDDVSDSALRRLLFEAGEDFEDLIILCKADITTKNEKKQKQFKENFSKVELKIKKLEERDRIRNFKLPITGEDIMQMFSITPGKKIGIMKEQMKNAILDGVILNNYEDAKKFIFEIGKQLNLPSKET